MMLATIPKASLLVLILSLFSACGGGGGDNTSTLPDSGENNGPLIELISPEANSTLTDVLAPLTFSITERDGRGVASDKFSLFANGVDFTDIISFQDGTLTANPNFNKRWRKGLLEIKVSAIDTSGGKTEIIEQFSVEPGVQALPRINPVKGFAPLTVQIIPDATTDSIIEKYEWDLDNDGVFTDRSDTVGRVYTQLYEQPGQYPIHLRVTDTVGNIVQATTHVDVLNAPPAVTAEASPSNGSVPLSVRFSIQATDNEGIAKYEMDYEGDGNFDASSETEPDFSHAYETPGVFQPSVKVTDQLGQSTELAVPTIEVRALEPGSPRVSVSVSPAEGEAPFSVRLRGSASDVSASKITNWSWDLDGDGVVDQEGESLTSISYEYSRAGTFYPSVTIKTKGGKQVKDFAQVVVKPSISLVISPGTVDTNKNEEAIITLSLGGPMTLAALIENRFGEIVKTLQPKQETAAGQHVFNWNGSADSGGSVAQGEYRAVMEYEFDEKTERFDLGLIANDAQEVPTLISATKGAFQPFAGNPLEVTFELDQASEVTLFFGDADNDVRSATVLQRDPLGAGQHTYYWNGVDTRGILLKDDGKTKYTVGIFSYPLAANAIFVRKGTQITDLKITPSIFSPDSAVKSQLSFTLSRAATLRLVATDATTGKTASVQELPLQAAGAITLDWDGKTPEGDYIARGSYRIELTAIDEDNHVSQTRSVMQQIYH